MENTYNHPLVRLWEGWSLIVYRLERLKGVEGNQHMGWPGGNVDHEVAGEFAGEGNVGSCEVVEVVVEEDCCQDRHRLGC